ncbi:primosomal protein DnaI [Paenibacillus shirakamiensis]|uniref:Primosomal protein DnaI n=1 Tax=Paenibacillus shirakamiensis TaxID=1265935 RepID=A0ABS4JK59_9BACL|nr:primosomal protein DnaI [Paenibacillus shirakamiensis]MBP2002092.1 primosomal protein DnaI [Paenibacillus shirakamiensis]
MESLGQMVQKMSSPQLRQRSQQLVHDLFHDPLVIEFRAQYPEISEQQLTLNLSRLYQYVKDCKHCAACPGLDLCPNDFQGHYTRLAVENVTGESRIYDRQVPCAKLQARETESQIKKRIYSFYVDERALQEGYDEVEIMSKDSMRSPAVGRVFRYINETRENGLSPQGLYMVGHFGTGKTFLMSYLLHELAKSGYSGVIVYMPEFVEDLKSMMMDSQKLKDTVELMKQADLLIFDDIGAENLNPWARDHVMGAILNYRMNRKPTFYTSNYDMKALERHLSFTNKDGEENHKGQRLMDRIAPFVDVVSVNGSNKRGNRNK